MRFRRCWHCGSSPGAWGTLAGHAAVYVYTWFIPTCVGNSSFFRLYCLLEMVHPHVRGELEQVDLVPPTEIGSSPRAWGTRIIRRVSQIQIWFIPTCVGNSPSIDVRFGHHLVHPQVRGELISTRFIHTRYDGSSPGAWGTRRREKRCCAEKRFIPRCVGNSYPLPSPLLLSMVHPHVRGELMSHCPGGRINTGSSPGAWGTQLEVFLQLFFCWFIPTCVGNS